MVSMRPRQCLVAIAVVAVLCLPLVSSTESLKATVQKTPPTWTIMVYMADDYPPDLPWQANINQMEAANQAPWTHVIVLVDPLGENNPMLLNITQDNGTSEITSPRLNDSGEVIPLNGSFDMGSPETLRNFIDYSAGLFEARYLVLVMWGHAGGWRFGLCPDGSDILSLPEFASALAGATADINRTLDLIVVDSCGEASLEMLSEIHPYANYFVASEKNIPSDGLPYTPILNGLAASINQMPSRFAGAIVDDFIDWSRGNSTISASMAAFDLSRIDALEGEMEELSRIGASYDSLFHDRLQHAFANAYFYTERWNVDLGDLLGRLLLEPLPPEIHAAAMKTANAYLDTISTFEKLDLASPFDGEYVARATGLVIYAPSSTSPDAGYINLTLGYGSWYQFGRLARQDAPTNYSSASPTTAYHDYDRDGKPDSVTVSWDGAYESNSVYVFREEPWGLNDIGNISSPGNRTDISTAGFGAGYLTLSASALNGNVTQAHQIINVTLFGQAQIRVGIVQDGRAVEGDLDVRITVRNSTFNTVAVNGACTLDLTVPTQAQPDDMVRVEVLGKGSEVIGETSTVLAAGTTTVSIETHPLPQKRTPITVDLVLAMLPGLLILVYDLQLYLGDKKKRRYAR